MSRIAQPQSLEHAIALLADEPAARPLGGGVAIQILRRQGLLQPPLLVDLAPLEELHGIHEEGGMLRIGSMTSQRQVERSALVMASARLLVETYRWVGNVRIRNTATVGGNLAHADYRLDPPAALLALGARLDLAGPAGRRNLALGEFFVDLLETALQPAELIVDVRVPVAHPPRSTAYARFSALGANDWPSASVAVVLEWDDHDGELEAARLGLSALAPTPLLVEVPHAAGLELTGLTDAAVETALQVIEPLPDFRGSASYKRRLAGALIRDTLARAWAAEREPARTA